MSKENAFEGMTFGQRLYTVCNLYGEDGGIPGPEWWNLSLDAKAAWEGVAAREALRALEASGELTKYFEKAQVV